MRLWACVAGGQVWAAYSPVKNSAADAVAKVADGLPSHSATTGELDLYAANCRCAVSGHPASSPSDPTAISVIARLGCHQLQLPLRRSACHSGGSRRRSAPAGCCELRACRWATPGLPPSTGCGWSSGRGCPGCLPSLRYAARESTVRHMCTFNMLAEHRATPVYPAPLRAAQFSNCA